ncbi:VOC family protein [Phycicoccus flavus]|uniref:VOC family protein n=1 Tax=Phycicoccus flavus TaxID=2502783 RepID=UPI000FEBC5D4|nr:VOC family protein [Phycicoccus flavus]NHA69286.1 VOC family protein [Phycicoccus flavus]
MFSNPQVVLFCDDVDRTADFYRRVGFEEAFRSPAEGPARHVDLVLDGARIGLAGHDASSEDHGFPTNREPDRAAVVLWCDDVEAGHSRLLEAGAVELAEPHPFLDTLRIAWSRDPEGHPIQVVQRVG